MKCSIHVVSFWLLSEREVLIDLFVHQTIDQTQIEWKIIDKLAILNDVGVTSAARLSKYHRKCQSKCAAAHFGRATMVSLHVGVGGRTNQIHLGEEVTAPRLSFSPFQSLSLFIFLSLSAFR